MKGRHYYDQLTPEQQERFKKNMNKQRPGDINGFMGLDYVSHFKFIFQSFQFDETPEGHDYWVSLANNPPPKNLAQALTPPPLMLASRQEPIYNSGVMLGVFIGFLTGTLLTMATREWVWQLIGLDIVIIAGIVYLYKRYRSEHHQGR